mmetsp:Transcript_21094/g.53288  ORF Transcript_21094/g.53288 Transcript_21094/m.53288 type:complete len:300 (+) Transcript_21094:644-1543(+)
MGLRPDLVAEVRRLLFVKVPEPQKICNQVHDLCAICASCRPSCKPVDLCECLVVRTQIRIALIEFLLNVLPEVCTVELDFHVRGQIEDLPQLVRGVQIELCKVMGARVHGSRLRLGTEALHLTSARRPSGGDWPDRDDDGIPPNPRAAADGPDLTQELPQANRGRPLPCDETLEKNNRLRLDQLITLVLKTLEDVSCFLVRRMHPGWRLNPPSRVQPRLPLCYQYKLRQPRCPIQRLASANQGFELSVLRGHILSAAEQLCKIIAQLLLIHGILLLLPQLRQLVLLNLPLFMVLMLKPL